jgi:hypothetical protein
MAQPKDDSSQRRGATRWRLQQSLATVMKLQIGRWPRRITRPNATRALHSAGNIARVAPRRGIEPLFPT